MSNWLTKSNISSDIANQFSSGISFDIAVHCSYYSCVQLMYHKLDSYFNLDQMEIDLIANPKINKNKITTHVALSNYFNKDIRTKHRQSAFNFNNDLIELKQSRVTADYSKDSVGRQICEAALKLELNIKTTLNKYYDC